MDALVALARAAITDAQQEIQNADLHMRGADEDTILAWQTLRRRLEPLLQWPRTEEVKRSFRRARSKLAVAIAACEASREAWSELLHRMHTEHMPFLQAFYIETTNSRDHFKSQGSLSEIFQKRTVPTRRVGALQVVSDVVFDADEGTALRLARRSM